MKNRLITVDVREDIRMGREPFSKIMGAANSLAGHQSLRLIAPFEPTPLYALLGRQGFTHQSKALEDGSWEIQFTRNDPSNSPSTAPAAAPDRSRSSGYSR